MLKRILILCCVVLLVFTMTVPAFAITGSTLLSKPITRAGLQFDTISFNAVAGGAPAHVQPRVTASWPFNESGFQNVHVEQSLNGSNHIFLSATVHDTSGTVEGTFALFQPGLFVLSAKQMFFSGASILTIGGAGDDGPAGFSKVVVSYDVMTLEKSVGGLSYSARSNHIYYDSTSDGFVLPSELNIGDLISRAYAVSTGMNFGDEFPALLSNVSIEVHYLGSELSSTTIFTVFATSDSEGNYASWVQTQDLQCTVNKGWFDWLLDSINSFMNFEIAPDFSLNELFWIVMVIAIILWFVKLIS